MNRSHVKSKATLVGLLLAMSTALVLPSVAAAATRPITFDVTIGDTCIVGRATNGATVELVWKSAKGNRKAKASVPASAVGGRWYYCSTNGDRIAIGDKIRANDGKTAHKLVVPKLTLVINRVDNRFTGRAPAGDSVKLICGYTNGFEPCISSWKIKVNGQGKWGFKPKFDVVGWQWMFLSWKSGTGDKVGVSARGPYLDVTIGGASVAGAARANAKVTVVLRRAGSNAVKATAVTKADPMGFFKTKFRNANGKQVKVRVGDRLTSDIAADEDWIVPNVVGNAKGKADTVTGTCPAESFFAQADVVHNGVPDGNYTWPEEDGTFAINLEINAGDSVRVSCYMVGLGDWVGRRVVAH